MSVSRIFPRPRVYRKGGGDGLDPRGKTLTAAPLDEVTLGAQDANGQGRPAGDDNLADGLALVVPIVAAERLPSTDEQRLLLLLLLLLRLG